MAVTERCIFKTPTVLRQQNENCFAPKSFTFGPLYHPKQFEHLKNTQEYLAKYQHYEDTYNLKLNYCRRFLGGSRRSDEAASVNQLYKEIKQLAAKARDCYPGPINLSEEKFYISLVVDSCFIIEVLLIEAKVVPKMDDPKDEEQVRQNLRHDMLLLENQIPWLLLQRIFDITSTWDSSRYPLTKSLTQLVMEFLGHKFFSTTQLPVVPSNHGCKHILDLVRYVFVMTAGEEKGELEGRGQVIPSVTNLVQAGIKFKKVTDSQSILNIKFNNGLLEIPALTIMETADVAFLNLIGFEQCYPNCKRRITAYAILLNGLIKSSMDMDILRESGIINIERWQRQDEAMQMQMHFFKLINPGTLVQELYYNKLCDQVNDYCSNWRRLQTWYMRMQIAEGNMASQIGGRDEEEALTEHCILKTPTVLRQQNENCFAPKSFTFGPLYHQKQFEHLKNTEIDLAKYQHYEDTNDLKRAYWHNFLNHAFPVSPESFDFVNLFFYRHMKQLESKARDCYPGPINLSEEEFLNSLVIDGCFIIAVLLVEAKVIPKMVVDPKAEKEIQQNLRHDLLLLENQIPWLLLQCLFDMISTIDSSPNTNSSLTQLVMEFFGHKFFSSTQIPVVPSNHGCKHILDLVRYVFDMAAGEDKGELEGRGQVIPSVTNLVQAGIKFKKVTDCQSILNIRFNNGALEIPPLTIMETTDVAFLNLITFEQCYPNCKRRITAYAILLNGLIKSSTDMDILRESGIINIERWQRQDEAMQIHFFKLINPGTLVQELYYNKLSDQVNYYCNSNWRRLQTWYMRNFTSSWAIASQAAAAVLIVTLFTVTSNRHM